MSKLTPGTHYTSVLDVRILCCLQIMMNRIATLTDPKGDRCGGGIDSEWVVGHHLMINNIKVGLASTRALVRPSLVVTAAAGSFFVWF